jgi:phage shock protein A
MKDMAFDTIDYVSAEAKLEGYLANLKDSVATLNRRIDELQTTLSQMRSKVPQLKKEDQVPLEAVQFSDKYEQLNGI